MKLLLAAIVSINLIQPIPYIEANNYEIKTVVLQDCVCVENILYLHNKVRKEHGLPELVLTEGFNKSAQAKLSDMEKYQYFAHVSPQGKDPWSFMPNYYSAGENLAMDYTSANEMMEAWMLSEKHRYNILKPDFNQIGIAVRGNIVVVHFARN